jgi:DNA polymerase-3 subunit beta
MHLKVDQVGGFRSALASVNRAIDAKQAQKFLILGNVLVETQGDSAVVLTCTDLDRRATETVPATVTEPGAIAIDATRLLKLVTALPDTQALTIVAGDDSPIAKVSSGRSRYQFERLNVLDFPQRFEPGADATRIELTQDQNAHLVAKTRFAISQEETRFYLCGGFIHTLAGDRLAVCATDGFALALASIACPHKVPKGVMVAAMRTVRVARNCKRSAGLARSHMRASAPRFAAESRNFLMRSREEASAA